MSDYVHMRESLARLHTAVSQARLIARSQQRRFEEGDIDMLDILEAQRQLYDAEHTATDLEVRTAISNVDEYKVLGGP